MISVLMLAILLVVFALPIGVIVLALRVRHIAKYELGGSEPRCIKCGYILTGVASEICPECGNPRGPQSTTYVSLQVQRRLLRIAGWLAVIGVVLFLLAVSVLLPSLG